MAIGQYQGVEGVARKVVKRYEGVEGVARQVNKAYTGVEGVARQYFPSGTPWRKWSCVYTPEDYYFVDGVSADGYVVGQNGTEYLGDDDVAPVITVSSSHYFDKVDGHTAYASWTKEVPVSDAVGYYQAFTTYVRKITKAGRQDGDIINDWYIEYEIVAIADVQLCPATYAEGYIDYGVVYIQGGEAPDGGEIVDGSFAGDRYNYCVVLEDGEYYWYNKIT